MPAPYRPVRQDRALPAAGGASGVHPEGEWEAEAAGDFDDPGQGGADAARLILEPIFEADFLDCSYGFRPGRSSHQALGYQAVYDADLQSYFDTISHERRRACLRQRIADRQVLTLIRRWLEAVVVEPGEGGTGGKRTRNERGTP